MRLKFFKRSQDDILECKKQYKTDATGVRIAGIDYNGIKVGQVGVERILQSVSESLLRMDFSQYQLCLTIRSMKDTRQRQEYIKKRADLQFAADNIYRALEALSLSPKNKELLDVVKEMFLTSVRAIDNMPENPQVDTTSLKEKIQDLDTKIAFYDIVIKKLDRMLDNRGFISMRDPEEPFKVHYTLVEIDRLMDQTLIDRDTTMRYREIRGPWERLYNGSAADRSRFVLGVRDFRNHLAISFNKLIPEYKRETNHELGNIELDEKEYRVGE